MHCIEGLGTRLLQTVCFAHQHGVTLESICRDHTWRLMEFSHHALANGITETTPIILYRENCITVAIAQYRAVLLSVCQLKYTAGSDHSRCLSGLPRTVYISPPMQHTPFQFVPSLLVICQWLDTKQEEMQVTIVILLDMNDTLHVKSCQYALTLVCGFSLQLLWYDRRHFFTSW